LHKTADIAPLGCDIVCENSSPSEFTASNRLHYRQEPFDTLIYVSSKESDILTLLSAFGVLYS